MEIKTEKYSHKKVHSRQEMGKESGELEHRKTDLQKLFKLMTGEKID